MVKKLWNDPVWSKVIAGIILADNGWSGSDQINNTNLLRQSQKSALFSRLEVHFYPLERAFKNGTRKSTPYSGVHGQSGGGKISVRAGGYNEIQNPPARYGVIISLVRPQPSCMRRLKN